MTQQQPRRAFAVAVMAFGVGLILLAWAAGREAGDVRPAAISMLGGFLVGWFIWWRR